MAGPKRLPVDYAMLAEHLKALSYPARLELLDKLRFPHTLSEIKITAQRTDKGENPDRIASRPAVLGHLNKLVAADMLRVDEVDQKGRKVPRYRANPVRLYALLEDMRGIIVRYAGRGVGADQTATLSGDAPAADVRGPRLVMVHGLYEGRAFALDGTLATGDRWVVGRAPGLAVTIDYDPYVSVEHAAVVKTGETHVLHDLHSKNGTTVNWRALDAGATHRLAAGDVIGVGRSSFVYVPS